MRRRSAVNLACRRGAAALCCAAVVVLCAPQARAGELEIQFIGNMAFHITDGESTLLFDFPYQSGAFGYMDYDMDAVKPIVDGVSVITHFHGDHWDPGLFEKMGHAVVAPAGVLKKIEEDRKIPINRTATFKDIKIEAIESPHRFAPEHFSYLIEWHGLRIFMPGDTETPAPLLMAKDIDVMFITPWLIRTVARQGLKLDARTLIVCHQRTDEKIPPLQNYLRMKQGQTIEIEFEDSEPGLD